MSLHSARKPQRAVTAANLPKVTDAVTFRRWRSALQGVFFQLLKNTNMDNLKPEDTIDWGFFEERFPTEYGLACKDAADDDQEPYESAEFLDQCLAYAAEHSSGYSDWVYDIFGLVRASLSDTIQDQTSGVPQGDILGLLRGIKMAVHHTEAFSPDDLDIKYTNTTFENSSNDLMTYLSNLTNLRLRLAAADSPVSDTKQQRVLLRGLPELFDAFAIPAMANQTRFANCTQLQAALEAYAATPRVQSKLRALKPGLVQHTSVFSLDALPQTRTAAALPLPEASSTLGANPRIDKLENTVSALTLQVSELVQALKDAHTVCHKYKTTGICSFGDKCKFKHVRPALAPAPAHILVAQHAQGLPSEQARTSFETPFYMV
jgi:hypothetical protein